MDESTLLQLMRSNVVNGLQKGVKTKSREGAIIQYLLYEGWVREALRRYAPDGVRLAKGQIVKGEYEFVSPEYDIIAYEGRPKTEAESSVAVVERERVLGIVEVEKILDNGSLASKAESWRQARSLTKKFAILCYGLWLPELKDTGETARAHFEREIKGARVFYLSCGWNMDLSGKYGYFRQPNVGEISRLAAFLFTR